jgi:hypothetical protein
VPFHPLQLCDYEDLLFCTEEIALTALGMLRCAYIDPDEHRVLRVLAQKIDTDTDRGIGCNYLYVNGTDGTVHGIAREVRAVISKSSSVQVPTQERIEDVLVFLARRTQTAKSVSRIEFSEGKWIVQYDTAGDDEIYPCVIREGACLLFYAPLVLSYADDVAGKDHFLAALASVGHAATTHKKRVLVCEPYAYVDDAGKEIQIPGLLRAVDIKQSNIDAWAAHQRRAALGLAGSDFLNHPHPDVIDSASMYPDAIAANLRADHDRVFSGGKGFI